MLRCRGDEMFEYLLAMILGRTGQITSPLATVTINLTVTLTNPKTRQP